MTIQNKLRSTGWSYHPVRPITNCQAMHVSPRTTAVLSMDFMRFSFAV